MLYWQFVKGRLLVVNVVPTKCCQFRKIKIMFEIKNCLDFPWLNNDPYTTKNMVWTLIRHVWYIVTYRGRHWTTTRRWRVRGRRRTPRRWPSTSRRTDRLYRSKPCSNVLKIPLKKTQHWYLHRISLLYTIDSFMNYRKCYQCKIVLMCTVGSLWNPRHWYSCKILLLLNVNYRFLDKCQELMFE